MHFISLFAECAHSFCPLNWPIRDSATFYPQMCDIFLIISLNFSLFTVTAFSLWSDFLPFSEKSSRDLLLLLLSPANTQNIPY